MAQMERGKREVKKKEIHRHDRNWSQNVGHMIIGVGAVP